MKKIFDESFESRGHSSRNIWYSGVELSRSTPYGNLVNLSDTCKNKIIEQVRESLILKESTETNWYFYDKEATTDALAEGVRTSLMIREKEGKFDVHINFSDHNFALNFEQIKLMESDLRECLKRT